MNRSETPFRAPSIALSVAVVVALAITLAGCGLAETAASGTTGAAAEAQQAPQIEQHVRDQVQAAQDAAAAQRDKAEQDSQ